MPRSAAPFLSKTTVGFFPTSPASVVSGTATPDVVASGNYGMSLAASATVKMAFPLKGMGQVEAEQLPPYEQYNAPLSVTLYQNELTVYYTVAGEVLTSGTIAIYATSYTAAGATVTTLLAAVNLTTAIGTYALQISLSNLPAVPVPNSLVVAELDIATGATGTAVVHGIAVS